MENSTKASAPRIPLALEISFRRTYAREGSNGTLLNISLSGAFLECEDPHINDRKLELTINVYGNLRKIPALIIWANSRGCGLKFAPKNGRDIRIIDDLIYYTENSRSERRTLLNTVIKNVA